MLLSLLGGLLVQPLHKSKDRPTQASLRLSVGIVEDWVMLQKSVENLNKRALAKETNSYS